MYTIDEICKRTGLTAHTLRYYEREKLLQNVGRSARGFRQYSDADIETLGMICCLKNTGMSLQEIARFMELSRAGDQTLRERCEMLKDHRKNVLARMEEMQRYLDKVTWKVGFYSQKLREFEGEQAEVQNENNDE